MKKTVTINISGLVFHIDEDAYEKLKDYLSKINNHFKKEKDGKEIVNDIETRIAELFTSKLSLEKNVVDISIVEEIITIMGLPEDFVDSENDEPETETTAPINNQEYHPKNKRLYRDPDSIVIGGVCSGLAHYLNMDKILVRVLFILLLFITSGAAIPVYIILWIAVPKAVTTAQRLEMQGEAINVENIGKKVKEDANDKKENSNTNNANNSYYHPQNVKKNSGPSVLSKIIGIILIVFGFISLLGLIIGVFTTSKVIGLLPGLIHSSGHNMFLNHIFSQSLGSTMAFSVLVILGIPLLLIIYFGTKLMFNFISNSRSVFLSALGVWIIGIIIAVSSIIGAVNVFSTEANESESKNLALPSDTIYIKMNKSHLDNCNYKAGINNLRIIDLDKKESLIASPKFSIEKSRGNYIELNINKYSKGNNYHSAKNNASKLNYKFTVSADTLLLDPYFELGEREKWRSQNIEVTLNIPEGKIVYLNENLLPIITNIDNVSNTWEGDMVGKYWKMNHEGLTLLK